MSGYQTARLALPSFENSRTNVPFGQFADQPADERSFAGSSDTNVADGDHRNVHRLATTVTVVLVNRPCQSVSTRQGCESPSYQIVHRAVVGVEIKLAHPIMENSTEY
jgi:hypothetical protein